jgi:hypothetical protein
MWQMLGIDARAIVIDALSGGKTSLGVDRRC